MEDYHPELAGYEPHDRPLRSPRRVLMLRGVVILAVLALVLPGVLTTYSYAESTAQASCAYWAQAEVPEQHRATARWVWFGPGTVGWECYAVTAMGERHVRSLGLIPVAPSMLSTDQLPA